MEKTIQEKHKEDMIKVMDSAFEELVLILTPVMHDKLKYREASSFVTSGKLKKAFKEIKKIIVTHQLLRGSN